MEQIREIKVTITIEVETNKRSIKKVVTGDTLSNIANNVSRELAYIEESIRA
jgi:hypothetical protein